MPDLVPETEVLGMNILVRAEGSRVERNVRDGAVRGWRVAFSDRSGRWWVHDRRALPEISDRLVDASS
jgi:hypothetical protein